MATRTLAERYRLGKLLGQGGMGQVWQGWDLLLERQVAVKLLHGGPPGGESSKLFLREARLAGALNHPGIVCVHDLGEADDGTMYLVMELLAGTDLMARLRTGGPPPVAQTVQWAVQLCDALAYAHAKKVIHRDLKPANLFLTDDGTLKILDFGIARHQAALTTTASIVVSTLAYLPPERLQGRSGDHRGDLYAVGCVLFELLTGQPPFGAGDPAPLMLRHLTQPPRPPGMEAPAPVSPELDRLILDLLAMKPEDRPASAAEVAERLRAVSADRTTGTPPKPVHPWLSASAAHNVHTAPTQEAAPLKSDGNHPTSMVFSPDSRLLAVSWSRPGQSPTVQLVVVA